MGFDKGNLWVTLTYSLTLSDFMGGVLKGMIFGWVIAVVSTFEGLHAESGPTGVGRATNRAIVRSMIIGAVLSLLISYFFFAVD